MNRQKQNGFTLIELIMVIVILGVLAATALPKFVNLGGSARYASLQSLQGSLNSAASIAYAQYLVVGTSPSSITTSDGTTVTLAFGYPAATTAGIVAMVPASGFTNASASGVTTFSLAGSSCTVTYTAATSATSGPPGVAIAGVASPSASTC